MLTYLGLGERDYAKRPISNFVRPYWEFQAVVSGRIAPVLESGPLPLRERCLWLFRAEYPHGWAGDEGQLSEIVVFQFRYVPEPLPRVFKRMPYCEVPLTEVQCSRLLELGAQGKRYWNNPAPGVTICYEHILMELSLMVCESLPDKQMVGSMDNRRLKVDRAISYYNEHMEENPSQEDVARQVGASPAHLRRLFQETLQSSPKQVFDQMRFQRAMHLMTDTDMKLHAVGEACGFGSPSAFSRAFKNKFGCSPESWRV
jgi:AraC-like DNA-binding protein